MTTIRRHLSAIVDGVNRETGELEVVERANGPAAAAVIGAGLGVFWLGLLTTLNEASTGIHDWLIFDDGVGPLSGKTTVAVVLWLASWAVLSVSLWRRNLPYGAILTLTGVFLALGIIGTFPKFFELFAD